MKIFALVAVLTLSIGSLSAQTPDRATTLNQLKGLIKLQGDEITRVEKDLVASKEYSVSLWTDLDKAQTQLNEIGKERDDWRDYGNDQHDKFINAEKRVAEQKVAKLKWIGAFSGLAILVAAYFGLKFFTPLGRFIP